jgi:hypothetical protein
MYKEPTWWLWKVPNEEERIQLSQILGKDNFHLGHRQPNGNIHAVFWPYLVVYEHVSDHKKLLVEMLLSKKIVKD